LLNNSSIARNFTLFNNTLSTGVSIPYPTITLHAIQRLPNPENAAQEVQGLYMQLELESETSVDDEEPETIDLTILPSVSSSNSESIKALFEAVSACSNLHPDPISQEDEDMLDDEGDSRIVFEGNVGYEGISGLPGVVRGAADGGLPPPFPGSGGWITAENVGEYFDEEGNWLGGGNEQEEEALGEGAGRVRRRDEVEATNENGNAATRVNGHQLDDEEEPKRLRTD
jgi:chloride channel, nucleotide-sensitive, 1A